MAEIADTDHIERNLAETRARIDRRLDELGDHLTPKQMVNDAFAYFRGGDGADFTQHVIGKVKANPMPVVLTGIGLAWLMASGNHPAHSGRNSAARWQPDIAAQLQSAEAATVQGSGEHPDDYAARLDDARGRVLGIARGESDTASDYAQHIRQAVASATQSTREIARDFFSAASSGAGTVRDGAHQSGEALTQGFGNMTQSIRDTLASVSANPVALGSIAAVIGLVAGALIPATEQEGRVLGDAADRLRTAGRHLAQDVVDRGSRVTSEAIGAVKDSAQAHGLTTDKPIGDVAAELKSGTLVEALRDVASETVEAGKASAQTHFAAPTERSEQIKPSNHD